MYQNRIRHIVIHEPDGGDIHALADKVSEFQCGNNRAKAVSIRFDDGTENRCY